MFHTYSTYARDIEMVNLDYRYLDLVPKGREEGGAGPSGCVVTTNTAASTSANAAN